MDARHDQDLTFGLLLRRSRSAAGLTQEELAQRSGLSVRAISDLERGRTTRPFMRSVRLLADAMMLSGAADQQFVRAARNGAGDALAEDARPEPTFPAMTAVPRQLPTSVRHFTGRKNELAVLHELLDQASAGARAMVISAISGTAGVGKTALSLHWAHQVAVRFPDGQLYADLQGFSPAGAPLAPAEALGSFLDALAVPPGRRPTRLEDQAALFRTLLAERVMLVVLDNARDAEHARLLLPGSPTCFTIVTSRTELTSLAVTHGAHLLSLDVMNAAEARDLLIGRLGRERVRTEESAAAELVELCARLPLALGIAAARAVARPGIPIAALNSELRHVPERLDALDAGDAAADMRAVFSWSVRGLNPPVARMFCFLGLHPGPDISVPAAASLAGVSPQRARRLLNELASAGLAREHSHGRYACHDLLRAYAAELATGTQLAELAGSELASGEPGWDAARRRAAVHRLLDHYLHAAHAASRQLVPARNPLTLAPPQEGVVTEVAADRAEAHAWLEAERPVLLAATAQAAELGFDSHAWQLPWALASFLDMQGHWSEWAATQRIALAAAQRLGDRVGQAHANRNLGCAYMRFDSHELARHHLRRATRLFGELDEPVAVARCWLNIAHTFEQEHRYQDALLNAATALKLTRASQDLRGQASAVNAIGWCHLQLGDYHAALDSCQQALGMYQVLGDRRGEAATLDSVGYAHHRLGQHASAIACCSRAAELGRELGDRSAESEALVHLGDAQLATGCADLAHEAWQRALTILDELRHPSAGEVRARLGHIGNGSGASPAAPALARPPSDAAGGTPDSG